MRPLLAWALYWAGDLVSRWNDNDRRFTRAGFDLYQFLMRWSDRIQGDGKGPWEAAPK